MEAVRFFAVAFSGVALDLAVAFALAHYLGVPLWAAAVCGFALAALANYAAHEYWTFRSHASRLSWLRAAQYIATSAATLVTRLAVILLLTRWLPADSSLLILVLAAGVSFFVNFLLSKFLIFSQRLDRNTTDP